MPPINTDSPPVTVIMPVRNEASWIAASLRAVLEQDYPPECLEIIVADGLSDDDTLERIGEVADAARVRVIANPRRLQSAGLNRALELAHGEIVVRVDGHTVIARDYVRRCVEALQETGAQVVGGSLNPVGLTTSGKAIAAASRSPFAIPSAFRVAQSAQNTDTVYLGSWRRATLQQVGCFDETLAANEDYELNCRIRQRGGRVFLSPDICSEYYGPQTLVGLARQHFRYGRWKVRTLIKHPGSVRLRHLAPPTLVGAAVMGLPVSALSPMLRAGWGIGLLLYGLLNLAFSLKAADSDVPFPYLMLVFLVIHAAWGVGFWRGVADLRRNSPLTNP